MSPTINATRYVGALLAALFIFTEVACSHDNLLGGGVPCGGGGQFAMARAALPDTGIDANSIVEVDFNQRDTLEIADVTVRHLLPAGVTVDPSPDPRVRLLNGVADVLLDTLAARHNQATWSLTETFRDSRERNAFYDAFQKDSLFLELWRPDATAAGTRVKLKTQQVGVGPFLICL